MRRSIGRGGYNRNLHVHRRTRWRPRTAVLSFLVFLAACTALASGQEPPAATPPAPQPAQTGPQHPSGNPSQPAKPDTTASGDETSAASIAVYYWLGPLEPKLRTGKTAAASSDPSDLNYPRNRNGSPGVIVSFPAGRGNALRLSFFRTMGRGNTVASKDLAIFGVGYTAGDYLSTAYTLRSFKASWEYLTWPFPARDRTFLIKTLWEVQYVTVRSVLDAPLKTDSAGNLILATGERSHSIFYPSFGIGLEKRFSRSVRWEGKASGFAWPHKAALWDADTFLAFRGGQFELLVGGKAYHFKTTPNDTEYLFGTQYGGYLGLRWYPKF